MTMSYSIVDESLYSFRHHNSGMAVRTEQEIRRKLEELHKRGREDGGGHMIEEMQGEVYALEYVLKERSDL